MNSLIYIALKRRVTIIAALLFSLIGVFLFFGADAAYAAAPEVVVRDEGYAAQFVYQSLPDPIVLEEGETKTVTFKFKNIGTATWNASGSRFISAYTMEPRYHHSAFAGANWLNPSQTGKVLGTVAPGAVGELELQLTAGATPGEYTEKFYLAAENHTWMKGGYFYIKIHVKPKSAEAVAPAAKEADVVAKDSEERIDAKRVGQNVSAVSTRGGERIKLVIIYQNTGGAAWSKYSLVSGGVGNIASSDDSAVSFADEEWLDGMTIVEKQLDVLPDASVREIFYLRAPKEEGTYVAQVQLHADGVPVDDVATVNIHVTENAPVGYTPPTFTTKRTPVADTISGIVSPNPPRLSEEPRIRVGLQSLDDVQERAIQFISYEDDYVVFNGDIRVGILEKTKIGLIQYSGGVYSFKGSGMSFRTNSSVRLEPANDPHAVFTLMNFDRSMSWAGSYAFNKYRGVLEYQRGQVDGEMYAVNDLLLEDYVRGVRETGTGAPIEMIKANLVAARTYAYISMGKYPFFDVLGSTYDQLYLGVESESVGHVDEAAAATRGVMVTYEGSVVPTPYFGNSNGYTKSWSSVWGGSTKPWLIPVRAEYDAGRRQFGHGVGMSQRDAALRAEKTGATWTELLKHYYTGVELERMYK
jgi:hypothetical protein